MKKNPSAVKKRKTSASNRHSAILEAANRVGKTAALSGLACIEGAFRTANPSSDTLPQSPPEAAVATNVERDGRAVQVRIHWRMQTGLARTHEPVLVVSVSAVYVVRYELGESDSVSDGDVRDFAEITAILNSWPYWREFLQSSLQRLSLPPMTLPLLRVDQVAQSIAAARKTQSR